MNEDIVLCRNSGGNKDYFDNRLDLLAFLTDLFETENSLEDIGVFIDGVSYRIKIKPVITKGWTSCDECRCCLRDEEE